MFHETMTAILLLFFSLLQTSASTKTHVDHQAQAYVAPRKVMTEANGNAPKPIANGKPKWGGAEVCPRCSKSVSTVVQFTAGQKIKKSPGKKTREIK